MDFLYGVLYLLYVLFATVCTLKLKKCFTFSIKMESTRNIVSPTKWYRLNECINRLFMSGLHIFQGAPDHKLLHSSPEIIHYFIQQATVLYSEKLLRKPTTTLNLNIKCYSKTILYTIKPLTKGFVWYFTDGCTN